MLQLKVKIFKQFYLIYFSSSTFSGNKSDLEGGDDKINIFSLASGHLYERLLR